MSEYVHLRVQLDDVHVRARLAGVDRADDGLEHADVLYFAQIVSADDVAAQRAAHPGCAVCAGPAADGGIVLAVRGGSLGRSHGKSPLVASVVHALLATEPHEV